MKAIKLFFCLIIFSSPLFGTDSTAIWFSGISIGKNYKFFPSMKEDYLRSPVSISIGKGAAITGYGPHLYNGLRFFHQLEYTYWGHPELGHSLGWVPEIQTDFIKNGRNFKTGLTLGAGILYFTSVFDSIENPSNNLISSRLNINIQIGLHTLLRINTNQWLRIGIKANHVSNGAFKVPNYGINALNVDIDYVFGQIPSPITVNNDHAKMQGFILALESNMAPKEIKNDPGNKHLVLSNRIRISVWGSLIRLWEGSVDFLTDNSIPSELKESPSTPKLRIGLYVGHAFRLQRFQFSLGPGIYLYNPFAELDQQWYQRYSLRYQLNKSLYISGGLLAHLGAADFMEIGIGVQLWSKINIKTKDDFW